MPEEEPNSWIELVWTEDRTIDSEFDLQEFTYGVLERAKENLSHDGYLVHGAWIVEPKGIHCYKIGHKSGEYKHEVYQRLVQRARELNAEAIVTLNDAYWGPPDPEPYYQGKLAKEGRECIWVCVTAPDKPSWELMAKYRRVGDSIAFEPTERSEGVRVNLLGSWSKEMKEIQ